MGCTSAKAAVTAAAWIGLELADSSLWNWDFQFDMKDALFSPLGNVWSPLNLVNLSSKFSATNEGLFGYLCFS